jgi:hypothetical protein
MAISNPLDPGRAAGVALASGRPSGRSVCEAGRVFLAEERPALLFVLLVNNIIHAGEFVNGVIHRKECDLDYKEATDRLFERITAADLAEELGVSQNAIARARLDPATRDYRPSPQGWELAVVRLAARRSAQLLRLIEELEGAT